MRISLSETALVVEVRGLLGYTVRVDTLIQDVKNKTFKRVYLITGDDPWLRHAFLKRLLDAAAGEDTLNRMDVNGSDFSLPELRTFTDTMPFFADRRVLLITDSGLFRASKKKDEDERDAKNTDDENASDTIEVSMPEESRGRSTDQVRNWLGSLPETAVVIFSETKADGRSALYKFISGNGSVTVAERPKKPEELRRFALNLIGKSKLKITSGAFDMLMDRLPLDYGMAETEIEKLVSRCLEKGDILPGDVEEMLAPRLEDRIFDLVEKVSAGDRDSALRYYYDLIRLRTEPLIILTLIGKDLVRLSNVREMSAKGLSDKEIMDTMGFRHDWLVDKYRRTAGRFRRGTLLKAASRETELELAVKSGNLNARSAAEILILTLTEKPSGRAR